MIAYIFELLLDDKLHGDSLTCIPHLLQTLTPLGNHHPHFTDENTEV